MPVNIRGRQYVTVAERLTKAHQELEKIDITTEVILHDPVVIKATVVTKKGTFTGISAANVNKQIEKETPYEVAESSAVGRALAFAGYETTDGIASAEEMKKITPIYAPKMEAAKTDDNFDGVKVPCKQCGADTIYKTGVTDNGKAWKGYFCSKDRSHKPFFVK